MELPRTPRKAIDARRHTTHGTVFARETGPEHVRQRDFYPLPDVEVQDVALAPELVDHLRATNKKVRK